MQLGTTNRDENDSKTVISIIDNCLGTTFHRSFQSIESCSQRGSFNYYILSHIENVLDPVVQSIVSLTISLRHKFVKQISAKVTNTLLFFVEKM